MIFLCRAKIATLIKEITDIIERGGNSKAFVAKFLYSDTKGLLVILTSGIIVGRGLINSAEIVQSFCYLDGLCIVTFLYRLHTFKNSRSFFDMSLIEVDTREIREDQWR